MTLSEMQWRANGHLTVSGVSRATRRSRVVLQKCHNIYLYFTPLSSSVFLEPWDFLSISPQHVLGRTWHSYHSGKCSKLICPQAT